MESLSSLETHSYNEPINGTDYFLSLPFLDSKIYQQVSPDNDPQQRYQQEIAYNKNVLGAGVVTLMFAWKKMHSGEKALTIDMDDQTFLRGMMESYVKLKTRGIDIDEVLSPYNHIRQDGQEVKLDGKEMEIIFHQLIGKYLEMYSQKFSGNLDKQILKAYILSLKEGRLENPFAKKTSIFPKKEKKYRMEERVWSNKQNAREYQRQLQFAVVTDDLLNYYIFKNMRDSDFTSILTPQNCNEDDYQNIKLILYIYDFKKADMMQDVKDYLAYKKDPKAFLKKITDETDKKSQQSEIDALLKKFENIDDVLADLAKYYRFKCIYETKDSETLTNPKRIKENSEIEQLLLEVASYLPDRIKEKKWKRIDY